MPLNSEEKKITLFIVCFEKIKYNICIEGYQKIVALIILAGLVHGLGLWKFLAFMIRARNKNLEKVEKMQKNLRRIDQLYKDCYVVC